MNHPTHFIEQLAHGKHCVGYREHEGEDRPLPWRSLELGGEHGTYTPGSGHRGLGVFVSCQRGWASGCPDSWLSLISGVCEGLGRD